MSKKPTLSNLDIQITDNININDSKILASAKAVKTVNDNLTQLQQELEDNKIESVNGKTGKNVQITSEDITTINPMHPNQTIIDYPLGLSIFHTQRGYRNEWNDVLYQIYTPKHANGHYRAIVETFKNNDVSAKQKVSYIRSTANNPSQGEVEVVFERGVQGNTDSAWGPWRRVLTDNDITDSLNVDDSTKVVSAKAVKIVNDNLTQLQQTVNEHSADNVRHVDYVVANGTNTYTASVARISQLVEGMSLKVKFTNANSGASTLNINGLGAKPIKKSNGNDLSSGNIKAGQILHLVYTGSNFQLLGEGGEYGNVTPDKVLEGVTFGTENGIVTGTMPNRGSIGTIRPGTTNKNYGSGFYNNFTVEGSANLIPANIKQGVSIFGITGTLTPESMGGVKYASGTGTSIYSDSNYKFYRRTPSTGTVSEVSTHRVEVTGLTFKPKKIIIEFLYGRSIIFSDTFTDDRYDILNILRNGDELEARYYLLGLSAYVNETGFILPAPINNQQFTWHAFG